MCGVNNMYMSHVVYSGHYLSSLPEMYFVRGLWVICQLNTKSKYDEEMKTNINPSFLIDSIL